MKRILSLILVLLLAASFAYAEQYTAKEILPSIPLLSDEELTELLVAITTEQNARYAAANAITYASLDELEEIIINKTEDTIVALTEEYEALISEIDTYEAYSKNIDRIESFYGKIIAVTEELCITLREYSAEYVKFVLESDSTFGDKYDELDDLYDCIYDDAGDLIYDEIYDGILDDMYDDFYDGLLDDAYDSVQYSEWSAARSDEYSWWSDARSDVYSEWSDFRSDVYSFWSDTRSAVYQKDIEKASENLQKFQEKHSRYSF